MNAVNAVQLLIVVWSFAVCQVNADDFSVNCGDVNGTVGNKVALTCSVSEMSSKCCIKNYNFKYPETYKVSKICDEEFPECEKRNIFTCRYTPTTVMKETLRFYIQTSCGWKTADFTVDISENTKAATDAPDDPIVVGRADAPTEQRQDRGFNFAVIAAVVSCVIIIIIIIMAIAYKIRKRRCLGPGHENESRYNI